MSGQVSLKGRRAIVTGGGRDFGRALSIWLAREGMEVDLCARNLADANTTAAAIRAEGNVARSHRCDLTYPDDIARFARHFTEADMTVDVLILSAAQWLEGDLADGTPIGKMVSTISSGLTGSILLADALLPTLRRAAEATMVTMVSSCGRPGYVASNAHPAFYAAKSGMAGFSCILGHRLAAESIRVCGVYPPDFETRDPINPPKEPPSDLLQAETIWRAIREMLVTPGPAVDALYFSGPTRESLRL